MCVLRAVAAAIWNGRLRNYHCSLEIKCNMQRSPPLVTTRAMWKHIFFLSIKATKTRFK